MSRNVQKGIQGDGQRNGQNCIARGAISTTTCFKFMWSLNISIRYIKTNNLALNINFQVFSCRKENKMEPIQHIK